MSAKKNMQPFFPHSANSRNEDDLIRLRIAHGAAGYGVYYMLMERLRQSDTYECEYDIDVLSFDLRESENLIESVIEDFNLFEVFEDGSVRKFRNKALSAQMQRMEEQRIRRQEAARRAAAARWEAVRRKEAAEQGIPYEDYIKQFVKPDYIEEQVAMVPEQPVLPCMEEAVVTESPVKTKETETISSSVLDKEISGMMRDGEWIEAIKSQHGLTESELADMFKKFLSSCKCEGKKGHKDLADAKSHFSRWLTKIKSKPETEKTKGKTRSQNSDQAFLKSVAEQNRRMAEQKQKRDQEQAERNKLELANRLKIIEMGYDPEKHKIWDVMNPRWREKNPPERKPESTPPKDKVE